jgi:hypothetical protein
MDQCFAAIVSLHALVRYITMLIIIRHNTSNGLIYRCATVVQPLFSGEDAEADLSSARGCFKHLSKVFEELAEYRAFELLRTQVKLSYLNTVSSERVSCFESSCVSSSLSKCNCDLTASSSS